MRFRKLRKNIKAISPVLSVLMMIAIAVAASLVAYAWVMGYLSFTTDKVGKAIQIQSVANSGADLVVYVQNVGDGAVELDPAAAVYVDGILMPCSIDDAVLEDGETATLTVAGFNVESGMPVKVQTSDGTFVEMTYYGEGGGSGGPIEYTLTINIVGNGDVTKNPDQTTYASGTPVDVNAVAGSGWSFDEWSGDLSGSTNPETITMDSDKTITATFTENEPDTLPLRPNGIGSDTELDKSSWWDDNWECVDDATSDGDGTYVYNGGYTSYREDTYQLENHGSASGTITSVQVFISCRKYGTDSDNSYAETIIRVGSTNTYGTQNTLSGSYQTYSSEVYTEKPGGGDWTWADIDSLQAGAALRSGDTYGYQEWDLSVARCTQVWVVVTYTP